MTETEIANLALSKIGGGGEQQTGADSISSIDDDTRVAKACKNLLPFCRKKVITDLATLDCPCRETLMFADLGSSLDSDDLPEIGSYTYAFNLPGDCLAVVRQFYELELWTATSKKKFPFDIILNSDKNGKLFLTNDLTNEDADSAYIAYVADNDHYGIFSIPFIDCIATLLAAEVCPVAGGNVSMRASLRAEYKNIVIPNAKSFNQSQSKLPDSVKPDYTGRNKMNSVTARSYYNRNDLL